MGWIKSSMETPINAGVEIDINGNIYDGYPAISTDNLTDDDVYGFDYHFNHHYDFEYLTPKYRARFKWVKIWCVRGDKGIRLVEVDLHNLKVLSGGD